ncbi:MAG: hypothetical protein L0I76_18660 [Pseudonocardia sp.]|nr:hypothetical protein [Pseudonocardia sp.]
MSKRHPVTFLQPAHQAELFRELEEGRHWVAFRGDELPLPVMLSLGRADDGRLICTGLVLGAPTDELREVTSRSLRGVPISELIGAVTALRDDPGFAAFYRVALGLADDAAELPRSRPGARGYDREHFEMVAATYRAALGTAPNAPTRETAGRLHVSEATARRWVQRARDMDLLGQSHPGKAGEQQPRQDEEGNGDGGTEDQNGSGR